MTPIPVTMTQLLKDPHSIQTMIEEGKDLMVFSRSKAVFKITPPEPVIKKNKKKFVIPTISFPIKGSLSRSEMYSKDSWLDREGKDKKI
ncbi:MAG: hypothetical protein AAGF07_00985 [Patescibacteria group bacterium]